MILLTDSYGNPCCIQEEWIQMAFICKNETDTTVLMQTGDRITVRESPEDVFEYTEGILFEAALEDNCETCRYQLNAETDEPCNSCNVFHEDMPDSQWESEDVDTGDDDGGAKADQDGPTVRVSGVPYAVKLSSIRSDHDE